jgi:hypothetical protein
MVVDQAGAAIADARVRVHPFRQKYVECRSQADGTFAVSLPPDQAIGAIQVSAPGFADLDTHAECLEPPWILRMQPGAPLVIRFTNADGSSSDVVKVMVTSAIGGASWGGSIERGSFEPGNVPLGVHTIRAFARGHQFVRREITIDGPTTIDVVLEPARERTVRFRITGANAAQLRQARCIVQLLEDESMAPLSLLELDGQPDEHGVFELAGLPKDAALRLDVRIPGTRAYPSSGSVAPNERDGVCEVPFAMRERLTREVRGRVVDEAGRGVGPLELIVYEDHTRHRECAVDAEGRFAVTTTLCDGEILRLWLAPGPRVFDSPTSLHYQRARARHLHVLQMPCDVELEIPTIAVPTSAAEDARV